LLGIVSAATPPTSLFSAKTSNEFRFVTDDRPSLLTVGTLTHLDFVDALREEAGQVNAALGGADLAAPVPSCPGWQVRELVGHLGGVHRWVTEIVRTGENGDLPGPPADEDLAPWFAEGAETLVQTLAVADPARACWTLARPRDVGFWSRRQAQETMIHRWDLARSLGQRADLDPELAIDGIDEVVTMFVPRQVRLARQVPLTDAVAIVERGSGRRWVLAGGGTTSDQKGTAVDATLSGDAAELLLLLWKRADLAATAVHVDGDSSAAQRVLSARLTP
jgi:uncharacterized protein (TIGR03083 family)